MPLAVAMFTLTGVGCRLLTRTRKVSAFIVPVLPSLVVSSVTDQPGAARALQVYHWSFLAQPSPMPENLIKADPAGWLEHTIASWSRARNLKLFAPLAMKSYIDSFNDPTRIHAACEDYRAGATIDLDHDKADIAAGRTISCPVLVLWGDGGIPAAGASPLDIWRATFAPGATGQAITSGHFLPEENPADTLAAILPFLAVGA